MSGATRKRRVADPEPLPLPRRLIGAPPPSVPPHLLPQRINVDIAELPPVSNVLAFPSRNKTVASPQPAVEVPLDLPTYTRPRIAGPTDAVDPIGEMSALPTRPRRLHPKGTVEYQNKLLTDLETMPVEKMSRKKAALYGFLRGLGSGNLLTGGIGAAVGALAPGATANLARRDDIAKAGGALDKSIDREGKLSVIGARRNQPQKEMEAAQRAEREKRIANLMTMHGRAGNYNPDDPNDKASQVIRAQAEELGIAGQLIPYTAKDKVPPHITVTDADGVETTFERHSDGDWRAARGLPTRKKESVFVPGYGHVTPAQKLQADATANQREYQRGRDAVGDTRHESERLESRTQSAARVAGEVAAANAEAAKWQDLAARTTDKDTKSYYESLAFGEKQKGNAKALELAQGYSDIYEAGPGEGGWAYVKPKAAPLPTRGNTKPGRIQPGEDANIRAYANKYFRGDYQAAAEAISKQKR